MSLQTYNVLDIGRYIINYSIDNNNCVSNLKLQKLLYYVQAAFIINQKRTCFNEPIVSWRHGPVLEEVYRKYRIYKDRDIDEYQEKSKKLLFDSSNKKPFSWKEVDNLPEDKIDDRDKKEIEKVIDSYMHMSAWEMVEKTHGEDPWKETKRNNVIEISKIKKYFENNKEEIYGWNY